MRDAAARLRDRQAEQLEQIFRNRYVVHNAWVISGTRIPTSAVWNFHQAGYSPEANHSRVSTAHACGPCRCYRNRTNPAVSSARPRFLAKHTSATPSRLRSTRLSREAKAPSMLTWRGARPKRRSCQRTRGTAQLTSPGLPLGIAQSRIGPERPVVRKILWP